MTNIIQKRILPRSFYERDTIQVAKDLIGKILVRKIDGKILSGVITEVEAYRSNDRASHAYRGKTQSNRAMFEEVGHAYIYFIYGNHFCLNVVARDEKNLGGGVLIRAIKPLVGIEIMMKNRGIKDISNLSNGPGKLAQALKITKDLYGNDFTKEDVLYITEGIKPTKKSIIATPRIGIKKAVNRKWRFIIDLV